MRKLIEGIVDFRERMLPKYAQRFEELALSQSSDALFITCSVGYYAENPTQMTRQLGVVGHH